MFTGQVGTPDSRVGVSFSPGRAPTLGAGDQSVIATGFAVSTAFGSPTITPGAVIISPQGFATGAFGFPLVTGGATSTRTGKVSTGAADPVNSLAAVAVEPGTGAADPAHTTGVTAAERLTGAVEN